MTKYAVPSVLTGSRASGISNSRPTRRWDPVDHGVAVQPRERPADRALGNCSALLQPALMEAAEAHTLRRAGLAAEAERRRLSQDFHDGRQGRLLGLALNLRLSGRALDDPSTRMLLDD